MYHCRLIIMILIKSLSIRWDLMTGFVIFNIELFNANLQSSTDEHKDHGFINHVLDQVLAKNCRVTHSNGQLVDKKSDMNVELISY